MTSGTSPLVSAETIFCRIGANGMILRSILLPLVFSYSATMARNEASSSGTKPWVHHTLAVLSAALAMKGRARVPIAARPTDPRSTERLLSLLMPSSLLFSSAARIASRLSRSHSLRFRRTNCRAMFEFAVFEFLMIGDRRENGLKCLPAYGTIAAHSLCEDLGTSRSRAACFTVHDLRLAGKSMVIVRTTANPLGLEGR